MFRDEIAVLELGQVLAHAAIGSLGTTKSLHLLARQDVELRERCKQVDVMGRERHESHPWPTSNRIVVKRNRRAFSEKGEKRTAETIPLPGDLQLGDSASRLMVVVSRVVYQRQLRERSRLNVYTVALPKIKREFDRISRFASIKRAP